VVKTWSRNPSDIRGNETRELHRVVSTRAGCKPRRPSIFRLSGRLAFTLRLHTFNEGSRSLLQGRTKSTQMTSVLARGGPVPIRSSHNAGASARTWVRIRQFREVVYLLLVVPADTHPVLRGPFWKAKKGPEVSKEWWFGASSRNTVERPWHTFASTGQIIALS